MIDRIDLLLAVPIRRPDPDETPLSAEEKWVAIRNGWRPFNPLREQQQRSEKS